MCIVLKLTKIGAPGGSRLVIVESGLPVACKSSSARGKDNFERGYLSFNTQAPCSVDTHYYGKHHGVGGGRVVSKGKFPGIPSQLLKRCWYQIH